MATEPDLSFSRLLLALLRHARLLAAIVLAGGLLGTILAIVLPSKYTAQTTFTAEQPQSSLRLPSGLAGLAGQLGISLEGSRGVSPEFFVTVLQSREILGAVLETAFTDSLPDRRGVRSRPLIEIMDVKAPTPAKRFERSLKRFRKRVGASVDRKSGVLTLSVEDRNAVRAAEIANRLRELLNRYNVERLQSQSRQQREFAQQRLEGAYKELTEAEQRQLRFLQTNRQYNQSPLLAYEAARLERAVDLKQEVVSTLTKAYEEARISEARSTPVLVVIDQAVPPAYRSSPIVPLLMIGGLGLGLLIGCAVALLAEASSRPSPDRDAARAELSAAWRRMRGGRGRSSGPEDASR
ncbi:MAG TPA: Wzz/FepE/Etk N-terminal domain-containing protein [Gemmatimonadales bacterium]|nr:Wzz/FepE/Etk N-terminal domain-containing protein [Gemmatimonadales bacterium]